MRVYKQCTQRLVIRSPKLRLNPGLKLRQRTASSIHLVTVNPEMASTETALCAFSKIQNRKIHKDHLESKDRDYTK
jgi:hypothetical protein